ncbi:hypothetical protein PMI40_05017 [Herbaspirillum sp. YR522]|nr:hypothetical protein PMI40_05017 [Herbaspirillum sp. YR522]
MGIGSTSGSETSVTRNGVTGAAVTITDTQAQQDKTGQSAEQTIALLNQDVRTGKDSSNTLNKNWNGDELRDEVEAQAKITQAFGQRAAKAIGDYAGAKETELRQAATKAALGGDQESADSLNAEAAKWADGGVYRVAAHAAIGALAGGVGGALGAMASASLMPDIATQIKKMELPQEVESALSLAAAAGLGAAVGGNTGAASGFNVDLNNRQLHQSEYDFAKKNSKLVAQKLNISELEAEARILAEMLRNSDKQTADAAGAIHDYEIISLVGCKMLNCNGYKDDTQYANHDYNSEFILVNENAYRLAQGNLGIGVSDQEFRKQNIISERIGKGALALTGCALAGPTVCQSAFKGLGMTFGFGYLTGTEVTTVGVIGGAYGAVLSGLYAKNLALWAGGTNSFMQSSTLFATKTGSVFGAKQVGVNFGNAANLGGSIDPLFDPSTNPWWGLRNLLNLVQEKQ